MLKKASKRLIWSIIALVASVVLCIGVCLAWFAANREVYGEGLHTNLHSKDIIDFKVTAYYLNEGKDEANAGTFTKGDGNLDPDKKVIDKNGDGEINTTGEKDVMRPFSLDNAYTTAVLYKIDYVLAGDVNSDKTFRIFAECPDTSRIKVETSDRVSFNSSLSNAVKFFNATANGSDPDTAVYTPTVNTEDAFTNLDHEKKFRVNFYNGIQGKENSDDCTINADGNWAGTKYVIMDYGSDRFAHLASLMLENGGSLNSKLNLTGDITLGMEEYTQETVVPETLELDDNGASFTQSIGSDVISHKWQFVVTYSDGSKKVIVGTNGNLSSNNNKGINIDTATAGKNTVKVTYTEGAATPPTCDVTYTVNPVIIGGTGVAVGDTLELKVLTDINDSTAIATGVDWELTGGAANVTIESKTDTALKIKGVTAGNVTVTATVTIGSTPFTVTSDITVAGTKVPVTSVTLNPMTATIAVGEQITITATVNPDNATNKDVTWSSSDGTVATAVNKTNKDGLITGVKEGTVTVTATADGGITATCTIKVEEATKTYTYTFYDEDGTTELKKETVNEGTQIEAPKPADKTGYTFDGWYTAKSGGNKVETFGTISQDVSYYARYTEIKVSSVSLDKTEATITVGGTVTLTATVEPANALNKTVTWSSSDDTVATVEGGKVKAVAQGTAEITATAGGITATCTVTVTANGGGETTAKTFAFETNKAYRVGDEIYSDPDGIVVVTATSAFSIKEGSADVSTHVQSNGNPPLKFVLKEGYTYTITMSVGSSGSGVRDVTLNNIKKQSGAGTVFNELTWNNIAAGEYSVTQSGNIRLQNIVVIATPI